MSKKFSGFQISVGGVDCNEFDPMFKTPSKEKNDGKQLPESNQVPVQRKSDEFCEYKTSAHYSPELGDTFYKNFDQNLEISEFQQLRVTKEDAQQPSMFKLI